VSYHPDITPQSTKKFLQHDDCYLEAGKVEVLLHLLEKYRLEERKALIFSQVHFPS
jgi:SWI/SNF-related matrix-associated actin-dependent regulator 1 of chromatin subfamily A